MVGPEMRSPNTEHPVVDLSARSVLVVDSSKKQRRQLERVLKSAVGTVNAQETLEGVKLDAHDLIAVSYDTLTDEQRKELVHTLRSGAPTRLLLFSSGPWEKDHRELFDQRILTNILAKNGDEVGAEDLLVTISKVLSRDIFGIEKYFPWGAGIVAKSTTRSDDKEELVERAKQFAQNLGVNERLATSFALVTDELLTNAFYNAPVDDSGQRLFASRDRVVPVMLDSQHAIDLKFCSDGRKIGVSVADPYGSLTSAVVLDYLSKCLRRDEDQIDKKEGGAGLGLFQAFGSVSHLVMNICHGRRCEAIGMIDVRGTFKDFAMKAKSFNIFVDDGASK